VYNMGNKQSVFTDEQLNAYQDCTFFTRKEILRAFIRFRELNPNVIPRQMTGVEAGGIKVPYRLVENMPEFRENPFRHRICQVFSEDGTGNMTFDDFLDMFSVFSEAAPREVKAFYAFKIYDFDQDNFLGVHDLAHTVTSITRNELTNEEIEFICGKVLEEADLDNDGKLSYNEFEHVISRASDFLATFHIRI
jgi:Ca2+-binding EF-hand superfamily protein